MKILNYISFGVMVLFILAAHHAILRAQYTDVNTFYQLLWPLSGNYLGLLTFPALVVYMITYRILYNFVMSRRDEPK